MTIATQLRVVTYVGNGVTTAFPFTFPIRDAAHLIVRLYTIADFSYVTLDPSAYSASGIGPTSSGGTVTYNPSGVPIPSTKMLAIYRTVPYKQELDIVNQSGFYPETLEGQLDNIVMQIQQVAEEISRTVTFPPGLALTPEQIIEKLLDVPGYATDAAASAAAALAAQLAAEAARDSAEAIVGLGYASQAEAEAGVENTKLMTALRTAQAITARTPPPMYETRAAAIAATIPAVVNAFHVGGYATRGDGGAGLYIRVASEPTHGGKLSSNGGTVWWELREREVYPQQFGAFPGGGNQAPGIQLALNYPYAQVVKFTGMFNIDTGVSISRSLRLEGTGNNWLPDRAGPSGLASSAVINMIDISGQNAQNITLRDFTVHGDGGRTGQVCHGIVIGSGGTSSTGTMNAGFVTFTHGSAIFTAADVGKHIRVSGAAVGGADLQSRIVSVNGAEPSTSVQLSDAASTTVVGASAYWVFLPENIRFEGVSTTPLHYYGILVENCNNLYIGNGGELNGTVAAVRRDNRIHADGGDDIVSNTQFYGGSDANYHHTGGGGLKLTNCKFLGGNKGYWADWSTGVSVNLLISNCSMEDQTTAAIQIKPTFAIGRIGIMNNTGISGRFLYIEDVGTGAKASMVTIIGNSWQARAAGALTYLGSIDKFIMHGNVLDGAGIASYGIQTSGNAANGYIYDNYIFGTTTGNVSNSGTAITVRL